jgi:sulfite exporter TauE/SafE
MSHFGALWVPGAMLSAPALFLAGTAAGPHCALMCGSLSVYHARAAKGRIGLGSALLWTHAGRMLGYALFGAAAGAMGQPLLRRLPEVLLGRGLQGAAAAAILLTGAWMAFTRQATPNCCHKPLPLATVGVPRRRFAGGGDAPAPADHAPPVRLAALRATPLPPPGRSSPAERGSGSRPANGGRQGRTVHWPQQVQHAARGLLWAAMPCGLLYSVLLLAALSGSLQQGALLAASFALGGAPLLAAIGWSGARRPSPQLATRMSGYWLMGLGGIGLLAVLTMDAKLAAWCATLR